MNQASTRWGRPRVSIQALLLAAAVGCQSPSEGRHGHVRAAEPAPLPQAVGAVDVGGLAVRPGAVPIPPEGLTLAQALIRAGGAPADVTGGGYLIQLRRGVGSMAGNYYLSSDLVLAGPAGDTALRPRDVVRVVAVAESPLPKHPGAVGAADGDRLAVHGRVATPGVRALGPLYKTLAQIESRENSEGAALVLTRVSAGGAGLDQFVLTPDHLRQTPLGGYLAARSDTLEFLQLNEIPFLRTGVAGTTAVRAETGSAPDGCRKFAHGRGLDSPLGRAIRSRVRPSAGALAAVARSY